MIASILMATGMAVSVLVKALLLCSDVAGAAGVVCKGGRNVKEWLRNKLKALASLPGRSGMKVAGALSGITGAIIYWILNRVKEVMGWILQNLWVLVISIGGLLYMYMVMRREHTK